jgi:hypothetical protein
MTYILVLLLSTTALTSIHGFKTQDDCLAAGKEATKQRGNLQAICIPQPTDIPQSKPLQHQRLDSREMGK